MRSATVLSAYLLPRSGVAASEKDVELLGSGCVGGLDRVGVDPRCRGGVGVTESGGDGGDWDAGVDHQGGVGVAQAVDGDVRQVVGFDKVAEPTADRVRVDRCAVGLGEQPVAVYPSVAHT